MSQTDQEQYAHAPQIIAPETGRLVAPLGEQFPRWVTFDLDPRFLGTRVVDVRWVTPLVLGHNYHAIHHLWPGIPWHRYLATWREKRSWLEERGVPIEHSVFTGRTYPQPEPKPGAEAPAG